MADWPKYLKPDADHLKRAMLSTTLGLIVVMLVIWKPPASKLQDIVCFLALAIIGLASIGFIVLSFVRGKWTRVGE